MVAPVSLHKKITWAYELEFEGKQQNAHFSVISHSLELYFNAFFLLKEERGFHFYAGLLYGYSRHCFLNQAIFECSFKEIYIRVCVCKRAPVCMHIYVSNPPQTPVFCHLNVLKQSFIFRFSKTGPSAASCWCSRLSPQPLRAGSLLRSTSAPLHLPPLPPPPPLAHEEGSLTSLRPLESAVCAWQPLTEWSRAAAGGAAWNNPGGDSEIKSSFLFPQEGGDDHQINCS